ncbi:MAG: ABC transporter transmembrane domain-containing protein, partial [Candidatus Hodarchaeota archaeon]
MTLSDEQEKRTISDKHLIRRLLPYLFRKKSLLFLAFLFILVGSILDVTIPYLVKIVIDDYIELDIRDGILLIGGLYLVLIVFNGFTIYLRVWFLAWIGQDAIFNLRKDTFDKLQELGMKHFDDVPVGDNIARLISDLDRMQALLSGQVLFAISSLLMIVGMLYVMLSLSLTLTLITLSTVPLVLINVFISRKITRP